MVLTRKPGNEVEWRRLCKNQKAGFWAIRPLSFFSRTARARLMLIYKLPRLPLAVAVKAHTLNQLQTARIIRLKPQNLHAMSGGES